MIYIYVLQLEEDKYYIHKTNKILNCLGSIQNEWLDKYKPLRIIEIFQNKTYKDVDKYTIKYMLIYGMDNVRGGIFSNIELSNENKNIINQTKKWITFFIYLKKIINIFHYKFLSRIISV